MQIININPGQSASINCNDRIFREMQTFDPQKLFCETKPQNLGCFQMQYFSVRFSICSIVKVCEPASFFFRNLLCSQHPRRVLNLFSKDTGVLMHIKIPGHLLSIASLLKGEKMFGGCFIINFCTGGTKGTSSARKIPKEITCKNMQNYPQYTQKSTASLNFQKQNGETVASFSIILLLG